MPENIPRRRRKEYIINLFKLADKLQDYLENAGVSFTDEGYPLLTDDMILREEPQEVVPLIHPYGAKDKSKTLLVSFCNDENIYKRLFKLEKDIPFYKEYMGFGGFDLSPRVDWDLNLQKFNLSLNMMGNAILAVNGVKIMPNFRTGCIETLDILQCYPQHSWFTVGTLGCAKGYVKINEMYLRTKLLITNPEFLIIYGTLKSEYASIMDEYGIKYKVYDDFQKANRRKKVLE